MNSNESKWNTIYKIGGMTSIGAVLVGVAEIALTYLPGGNVADVTVLDWLDLFQKYPFMGLRNLGLLNIFLNVLGILTYSALYAAHRKTSYKTYAAFSALLFFLGAGIYFVINRAFPMLVLSQQYAVTTSETQRAVLEATAQSMLAAGRSHTSSTFIAFFLTELAGVLISFVMLRSKVFSRAAGYAGLFGFGVLIAFDFLSAFVAGLNTMTMLLATFGGLLSMAWYIMTARRLFQLSNNPTEL